MGGTCPEILGFDRPVHRGLPGGHSVWYFALPQQQSVLGVVLKYLTCIHDRESAF